MTCCHCYWWKRRGWFVGTCWKWLGVPTNEHETCEQWTAKVQR